jgi:peptidoglycan/xylan/chitin deacetylase (PgdA/CDA1 family)
MASMIAARSNDGIVLNGVAVLGEEVRTVGRFRPHVGSFGRIAAEISGPGELVAAAGDGLPDGAALAEAIGVRLRRRGFELAWGEPSVMTGAGELLALCERRGRSSVEMARADPSLVTELQIGSWFDADWRVRLLRRVALPVSPAFLVSPATPTRVQLAADLAFWRGVRASATPAEWERWTRTSYVALVYHRLAGELKPGQERIDLAPGVLGRQLRLLRRLGFRHLRPDEVLAFHRADAALPPRAFVATVDDGFLDCFRPLMAHADLSLQLFVPTRELGGRAHWADEEPVMSWEDVRALAAAGVAIGAHARHHRRLRGLDPAELADELAGSRADLRSRLESPLDVVAYPHGDHDADVRAAAVTAGFQAAFTTEKGRNGAGTEPYCLRRVSVHGADGALAVLWKVLTGEALPLGWLRLRAFRQRPRRH